MNQGLSAANADTAQAHNTTTTKTEKQVLKLPKYLQDCD